MESDGDGKGKNSMTVVRNTKGESLTAAKAAPGADKPAVNRARSSTASPAPEVRPEGGPGEWLQQFAWALEDGNLEWTGYYLKWLESENETWAVSQAFELGVERLQQAPDGKGSAASLVRVYHQLGPLYPKGHKFHELFLDRLQVRVRGMAPGAAALTVASAIERALELFQKGLETYPAYAGLLKAIGTLKDASNRIVQQEKERELEALVAEGDLARAIELSRHLIEQHRSPLAAGLMPTLLARAGSPRAHQDPQDSVVGKRLREWDWPETSSDDDPRSTAGRRLRMIKGDKDVQLPNKPWSKAFEAPPRPERGAVEPRSEPDGMGARAPRRDDPVTVPDPIAYDASRPVGDEDSSVSSETAAASRIGDSRVGPQTSDGKPETAASDAFEVDFTPSSARGEASSQSAARTGGAAAGARTTATGGARTEKAATPPARAEEAPLQHPDLWPIQGASKEGPVVPVPPKPPYVRWAMLLAAVVGLSVLGWWMLRAPEVPTGETAQTSGETGEVKPDGVELPAKEPEPTRPEPPKGPPSTLTLEVTPVDKLELYLDGVFYPEGKLVKVSVPSGKHVLEVFREGFEPFRQELVTNPDLETKMLVTLTRSPQINLEVTPSDGSEVLLNGRRITARLPLKGYVIPPGRHTIQVNHQGYVSHVEEFTAITASSLQLNVVLKPEAQ